MQYGDAKEQLKNLVRFRKRVEAKEAEFTDPLLNIEREVKKLKKTTRNFFRPVFRLCDNGRRLIERGLRTYENDEKERRRKEDEKARLELQKEQDKAEARAEKKAERLEAKGDVAGAEMVRTVPILPTPTIAPAELPKVDGVKKGAKTWTVSIINLEAQRVARKGCRSLQQKAETKRSAACSWGVLDRRRAGAPSIRALD